MITDKSAGVVPSGCEAPGERLTQCLLRAPPKSFYCTKDKTGWRRELCAEEQDALAACQYFSYSCANFCGQQAQSCGHDVAWCTESCRHPLRCEPEFAALYNCLDSGPTACAADLRRSTRPDCGDQRALADACITDNPDYFRELPPAEDGGISREQTDASDGGALPVSEGGAR